MSVHDLNRNQLDELKGHYITEMAQLEDRCPSWGELADAQVTVSDETIYKIYADISFTPDDFICTAGGC